MLWSLNEVIIFALICCAFYEYSKAASQSVSGEVTSLRGGGIFNGYRLFRTEHLSLSRRWQASSAMKMALRGDVQEPVSLLYSCILLLIFPLTVWRRAAALSSWVTQRSVNSGCCVVGMLATGGSRGVSDFGRKVYNADVCSSPLSKALAHSLFNRTIEPRFPGLHDFLI